MWFFNLYIILANLLPCPSCLKIIPPKFIQYLNWPPIITGRSYHLGSSVLFCFEYKIFAVIIDCHWFKTVKMLQSRMLTSLRRSSLVPDFLFSLLQLFTRVTVHSAQYLLHLNTLLVSVCSKHLLICFADHWRKGLVCWQTFSWILQLFFYLLFFLSILFFTHDVLPSPTTHTHYPQHLVTLSLNRTFSRRPYRVSQNNKTAAMLVFQTNPGGVDLFSYVNTFFC